MHLALISCALVAALWCFKTAEMALNAHRVPNLRDFAEDAPERVSIIVPARNEEADLPRALEALRRIDHENLEVILVDDRSADRSGALMDEAAWQDPRFRVAHITELPPGWLGKPHAMFEGARLATGDWLLFTDADVVFAPDTIGRSVACAETLRADHFVVLPRVETRTIGEHAMVAFFQMMLSLGYRIWRVSDPAARDYIGIGAFNMIRRSAYEAVGTHHRLRLEVLDDMKLGKLVKDAGLRSVVADGGDRVRVRWARGAWGVVRNLTKNTFAALRYSLARAIGFFLLGIFTWVYPYVAVVVFGGWTRAMAAVSVAALTVWYVGIWRRSRIPPWAALLQPVIAIIFCYIVARSTYRTLRHGGVEWRGTFYSLADLRRGLI